MKSVMPSTMNDGILLHRRRRHTIIRYFQVKKRHSKQKQR